MSTRQTLKIEGGSGGKRGHSNMAHRERTEIIKTKTARLRRQTARACCRLALQSR